MPDPAFQVLEKNAAWAETFDAPTVNIAQRRRFAQDKQAHTEALVDRNAELLQQNLARDKGVQDLHFRQLNLEREERESRAAMEERQQRMKFSQELHPIELEAKRMQVAADLARERATAQATALAAKSDLLKQEHTAGFSTYVAELMDKARPGTDDWKLGFVRGVAQFPHADAALMKTYGAEALEDEDLNSVLQTLPAGYNVESIRRDPNSGKWGVAARPEAADKPKADDTAKRLTHLENLRMRTGVDPDVVKYLDEEITKLRAPGDVAAPSVSPAAAPATAQPSAAPKPTFTAGATATKNGITYVRSDDGKWLPK